MSVVIFVGIPLGWAILARALGWVIAAATFYHEAGKRLGQRLSRWCMPIFPALVLAMLLVGAAGNAGQGFTLFGSEELLQWLFDLPFYAAPAMILFAWLVYVVRDLTLGHVRSQEAKS